MNILKLTAENVKRVSFVEIEPETGEPVILTGDNGAGKSTILDSILMALQGKKFTQPIKNGEAKATIKLDIGEYVITRKITQKGSYLEVVRADGEPVASPQSILDSLYGQLTLDPLEFSRMKPTQQRQMLMEVAGLNFETQDALYTKLYSERTAQNRIVEQRKAVWEMKPKPEEGTPVKYVDTESIMEEIAGIKEAEKEKESIQNRIGVKKKDIDSCDESIKELKAKIARLESEIEKAKVEIEEYGQAKVQLQQGLDDLLGTECGVDYDRLEELENQLRNASQINDEVNKLKDRKTAFEEYQAVKAESDRLTEQMEEIKANKEKALREAEFPLPGLNVDANGVTYQGTAFDQLSTGEQILVSTMIAMKLNPGVKIIMIREGALINTKNLGLLFETAKKHGYQVWMEKFQEAAGTVGLHLVDGSVVAKDGEPVSV